MDIDDSDLEMDENEARNKAADEQAKSQRKKAGLPELELDALPSSIATKMVSLAS